VSDWTSVNQGPDSGFASTGLSPLGSRGVLHLNVRPSARFTKFTKSPVSSPPSWSASTRDIDLHAKRKKLLGLADAQFLAGQTPDLPKLQLQLRELKVDIR
jgi:hypothetical protein